MSLHSSTSREVAKSCSWRYAGLACLGLTGVLLLVLKGLPYSSVRLEAVDALEATKPPSPDFTLGPLRWPVAAFAADPALGPFREVTRATCGDAVGLDAAACATRLLAARVPIGNPSTEYVDYAFDPVRHFEQHMAGEPGHCLTRSAMLTAQLLAVGVPARVVQLVPASGRGHTLVEVWDAGMGWTVVDPSTGGFVTGESGRASAPHLLAHPDGVRWHPFGHASDLAEVPARDRYFRSLLTGNVFYPEPWLYLRLGERVAPWPLRGHYMRVGPTRLIYGPAQEALMLAAVGSTLSGLGLLAFAGVRRPEYAEIEATADAHGEVESLQRLDVVPPV